MHGARRDLLAGAALSCEQHGDVTLGAAGEQADRLLHGVAASQQRREPPRYGLFMGQRLDADPQGPLLDGVTHGRLQSERLERLGDVIDRAVLHAADHSVWFALSREHEDRDVGMQLADLQQQVVAWGVREPEIEHDGREHLTV